MKNVIAIFVSALCCLISVSAQEERNQIYNIMLGNVQYTHSNDKETSGEKVNKIVTGIATGKTSEQLRMYESDVKTAIVNGLASARRYHYTDSPLSSADSLLEGNLLVEALITNITGNSETTTKKDKEGKTKVETCYSCMVETVLAFKNLKNGLAEDKQSFRVTSPSFTKYTTQDDAVRKTMDDLSYRIKSWLNKKAPLQASIIEGTTAKKDKQKEVYIDLGSREHGVVGIHFGVYVMKNVAGQEAMQQIGKLKVEAVEGENLSRCKVQSGGKEIKSAIDSGLLLKVISLD